MSLTCSAIIFSWFAFSGWIFTLTSFITTYPFTPFRRTCPYFESMHDNLLLSTRLRSFLWLVKQSSNCRRQMITISQRPSADYSYSPSPMNELNWIWILIACRLTSVSYFTCHLRPCHYDCYTSCTQRCQVTQCVGPLPIKRKATGCLASESALKILKMMHFP